MLGNTQSKFYDDKEELWIDSSPQSGFVSTIWVCVHNMGLCPQSGFVSTVWYFVYCLGCVFFPTKNMIIELGLVFQNIKLANEMNILAIGTRMSIDDLMN